MGAAAAPTPASAWTGDAPDPESPRWPAVRVPLADRGGAVLTHRGRSAINRRSTRDHDGIAVAGKPCSQAAGCVADTGRRRGGVRLRGEDDCVEVMTGSVLPDRMTPSFRWAHRVQ
jgi:hypothetical protein